MERTLSSVAALLGGFAAVAPIAHAQCTGSFVSTPGMTYLGTSPSVNALTLWDPDGPGPLPQVLVAGGTFDAAGMTIARNIAAWDGSHWSPIGGGIASGGSVESLAVLHDGRLVAAGTFTGAGTATVSNIAVWDGVSWAPLGAPSGANNTIWALAVAPSGDLYAGGLFTTIGGASANRVAKWNGTTWSSLGTGTGNGVGNVVYTIAVSPGGDVIVGGGFTTAGGALSRYIARWTGSAWQAIGGGMNSTVLAVAAASNTDIVASGTFTFPAQRIARLSGTTWTPIGNGLNAQALTLAFQEDGSIIAGGQFFAAGTIAANRVARWDGSTWTTYGAGMDAYVIAQATMPNGDVYFGGGFTTADGLAAPCIARWSQPGGATFSQQPASVRTCSTGAPAFTVALATGAPALRWQAQLDPGVWTDLLDGPITHNGIALFIAAGAATTTLSLSALGTFDLYGPSVELRCSATDPCGSTASAAATLRVCRADYDCNGALGVPDIFAFLNAWFQGDPSADFNHTGGLNVQDVFDFLAAWFAGC